MKHFEYGFALIETLLISIVVIIVGLTGWYVIHARNDAFNSLDKAGSTKSTIVKKSTSKVSVGPPSSTNQAKPNNTPFSVSKVYFAQAPKRTTTDTGPGQTQCKAGDTVSYQAVAQVSATNKGTLQYHWEVEDHLGATIQKLDNQSYSFDSSGTKNITGNFTYAVRETNGPNYYWNRLYLNLVATSPNNNYANKENPVYAYKDNQAFFIWGTYIDLC
jgi:Tfp pilus assembly protein PilV